MVGTRPIVRPAARAARLCACISAMVRIVLMRGAASDYPGSGDERVEGLEQVGRALRDRRPLARDRRLVAARDRAGEGLLGARSRPVLQRRAGERDEQLARDAGGGGKPLGGALERDEEVRGDRGGGVVGGAVGVGDLDGASRRAAARVLATPSAAAEPPATAQPAPANGALPPAGTVIRGWRLNASWSASGVSVVAPEQWPTYRARPGVSAAAAAAISWSGTHSSATSAAGSAPRPSGPSTSRAAPASAAPKARPMRPAPMTAQRRGGVMRGFRSSSRTRYRLGWG